MPNLPFRPPPGLSHHGRLPPQAPLPPPLPPQRSLEERLRRVPWFLLSALIHACALVVIALTAGKPATPAQDVVSYVFEVGLYPEQPSPAEAPKPPDPQEEEQPTPVVEQPPEAEPAPRREEIASPPPPPEAPRAPAETEAPRAKGTPVLEVPGGDAPSRDLFAARTPAARAEALRQGGGSPASERAVEAGLAWLARHQEADGQWADGDPQHKLAPGLTGLAVLAFLGKGHTHADTGPYSATVARGLRYLLSIQTPEGRFGEPYLVGGERNNRFLMYHQAIATMALSEAFAMSRDPALRDPVRRGVAFIERAQQDAGGWDYGDLRTGRNDTSVTGWQLMALKSAHASGIEVNWQTVFGLMRHFDTNTNSAAEVTYANRDPCAWRKGPGMAAVGLFAYLALGWPRDHPLLMRQADLLLANPPDWATMAKGDPRDVPSSLHTMYYWYYGTLALFQMGGQWWARWNPHLRDLLIAQQCSEGERRGSWDPPPCGFDAIGGRVYTTALNVLTLEVYYRYLPFYQGGAFDALDVLEKALRVRGADPVRRRALHLLGAFASQRAEDLLADALNDPDPGTRAVAQRLLVERKSERVVPTLLQQLESLNVLARMQAVAGLGAFGGKRFIPQLIQALRDPERAVRERAINALRKLTGESFGFLPDAAPAHREEAAAHWERWWRGEVAQPPPEGIRAKVLVVDEAAPDAVVLDAGSNNGVHRGLRFEVRRAGKTIAILQAEKVDPTLTLARIVERLGEPIREGDELRSLPDGP